MFEIKAQVFTTLCDVLIERKQWDSIEPKLSASTRELTVNRPPSSAWIAGGPLTEVQQLIEQVYGAQTLRECALLASNRSVRKFLLPFAESVLRLFGLTPWSLLSRMNQLTASSVRGMSMTAVQKGTHGAVITLEYTNTQKLPQASLEATAGGLMSLFELVPFEGKIVSARWVNTERSQGQIEFSWTEKKK